MGGCEREWLKLDFRIRISENIQNLKFVISYISTEYLGTFLSQTSKVKRFPPQQFRKLGWGFFIIFVFMIQNI